MLLLLKAEAAVGAEAEVVLLSHQAVVVLGPGDLAVLRVAREEAEAGSSDDASFRLTAAVAEAAYCALRHSTGPVEAEAARPDEGLLRLEAEGLVSWTPLAMGPASPASGGQGRHFPSRTFAQSPRSWDPRRTWP